MHISDCFNGILKSDIYIYIYHGGKVIDMSHFNSFDTQ